MVEIALHALIGSGRYFPEDVQGVMKIIEGRRWDIESIIIYEFPCELLSEIIEKAFEVEEALNVVSRY